MKHLFKRTVVLLNEIGNIENILKKAIELSNKHNTTLEVLFVHEEPLFSLPDYFISEDKIEEDRFDTQKIKEHIEDIIQNLNPKNSHSILVRIDDSVNQLIEYGKEQKEILVVTNYNRELTPQLIKKSSYSFWIIKNEYKEYSNIVLPLDLTELSKKAIKITQHLFSTSSLRIVHDYRYLIDRLYIQEEYLQVAPVATTLDLEINKKLKKRQKSHFEEYKKIYDIEGDFIEEQHLLKDDLANYINEHKAELTVMYRQDGELFFSPTLIEELIKLISTDFLILTIE